MDEVRKAKAKERKLPNATSWAVLKAADGGRLTEKQQQALTRAGNRRLRHRHRLAAQRNAALGSERPPLYRPHSGASPTSPAMPLRGA
ncbi:hypothetical protein DFAR_1860030 [Desulfarculales bacterium]